MNCYWHPCRSFLRRHAEALFIVAFIIADCFASGWFITLAASVAILAVSLPAIRNIWSLNAAGRVTYLQGLVKTPRVQRLGLLLFWLFSIRWLLSAAADAMIRDLGNGFCLAEFSGCHHIR
jgi:hypothetical protein